VHHLAAFTDIRFYMTAPTIDADPKSCASNCSRSAQAI
jgi:hypothetical protein